MSPSVSVYAVASSDELRMKAKYSPISHRIAVTPPKPTTSPKSSKPRMWVRASAAASAPLKSAQLTKWFASSHQSMVS